MVNPGEKRRKEFYSLAGATERKKTGANGRGKEEP